MRTPFKPLPSGPKMYAQFFEDNFDVRLRTGSEWMALCRWHDNTNSPALQINVDKGLYVCFSCGASGSVRSLERELGVKYSEPEVTVQDLRDRLDALQEQAGKPATPDPLPESLLKRFMFPTDYWGKRGLTEATCKAFDLGFDPMVNAGVIPLRNTRGELMAFLKRYLDDDADTKYKMPLKERYSRSANLFGSWLAAEADEDEIVVCEGPLDAIKIWQAGFPAVAQFGSSISNQQVRLLRRLGFNRAVLFYDNDKAGHRAVEGYTDGKGRLHPGAVGLLHGFMLRRVTYDPTWRLENGARPKDPGGLTDRQIRSAIKTARRI